MSWHCSRALVAGFSAANCSAGVASALSNTTPTPDQYYWPDKTTEHSRLSRFGMTCVPLTADRGADLLMWFLEGFPARTSVPQERATAWTASAVGSGRKWLGLLARFDPDSRSWRTPQCSLVEGLDEFSETWPRWGSMRNGECWERMTWEPPINENASGLLPTPVAIDAGSGRFNTSPGSSKKRPTLALMARKNLWPTPTVCWNYNRPGSSATSGMGLASAVKLIPTPVASMSKGSSPAALTRKSGRSREHDRLDHYVMASDAGPLNPDWVEWLMGWPIGQTDLKPLETGRFQEWQQQHGAY